MPSSRSTITVNRSRRSRDRSSSRVSPTRRASRQADSARRGKHAATLRGTPRARCSLSSPAARARYASRRSSSGTMAKRSTMTPLLRSSDILSEKAIALLELLGDSGIIRVHTTLGPGAGILPHRPQSLRAAPGPRHGRSHAHGCASAAGSAARGPLLRWHPGAHPGVHLRGRTRALQAWRSHRHSAQ